METRLADARAGEGLVRATLRTHGQTVCSRRAALRPEELIAENQVGIALFAEDIARARTQAQPHRPEDYPECHDHAKTTAAEAIAGELHSPVNLTRGDWALDRRRRLVRTAA